MVEQLTPNVFMNYGTTETGMVAVGNPELLHRRPDSVGRVVPWARAQIVDEQDRPLPAGEAGILRFRSIGAADGYYRNPAASAKTFRDGWVYPGDIARLLPDGALVIESRIDDVINVGGIKVEPAGIEDALNRHPDVIEAAVFGAKDRDEREILFAAVVLRGAVDEQALIRHCEEQVGRPVPRRIITVRELPRNEMGKVVKHELAAAVMTGHTTGSGQAKPAGEP
jgi:acyl-coenzyme A synthetase/AMP-(fatty) acid ligase